MTAKNKHTKDKNSMKELFSEGLGAVSYTHLHSQPVIPDCCSIIQKFFSFVPRTKSNSAANRSLG